jgi:predicted 2-oxoglutarate/Fe(II)-dependent dioxygenase YbiX
MNHLEAVMEIKNVISPKFIDKIIPLINSKATQHLGTKAHTVINKNIRNVKGHGLTFNTPTDIFYWNFIKAEIQRLFFLYTAKFPMMMSSKINQIDLLKYSPGGKYEVHVDNHTTATRHLSVIMNLNNEYEGGDLIFTDQKGIEIKKIKLDKGSIIFFPSTFLFPHKIEPITKGTRYSIVAWLQ